MSVAESISGALRRFGRQMTLRRPQPSPTPAIDVTVFGRTKGFASQPLAGELREGETEVTITNAEIAAASWPGPPRVNDIVVIDGKTRTVFAVEPKYLGSEVLVFVMKVRG